MLGTTPRRRRSSQQILRKISEFPQDSPAELGYSPSNGTHTIGSQHGVHENRFSNEEQNGVVTGNITTVYYQRPASLRRDVQPRIKTTSEV